MISEVGGVASEEVRRSIDAMGELTRRVIASGAETVVLISPHAPLEATAFVAYDQPNLHADFANFRASGTRIEFQSDEKLLDAIASSAARKDYEVQSLNDYELDHGSAVPLYFLKRNGWNGRVVVLGYSFLSNDDHLRFGGCVKSAADEIGRPVAFIASGDLSHRLKPDAPAGYHPAAYQFDSEVVDAIDDNCPYRITEIDHDLRRTAGECGYRSMLVALGVARGLQPSCEVLNYEAPFGVGYLVAQLTNVKSPREDKRCGDELKASAENFELTTELPALARLAVETFVRTGKQIDVPAKAAEFLSAPAACFVSIKTRGGELRGCIGTIEPQKDTLAEELIANAISCASRDPRFDPITEKELDDLRYSVDVLAPPEPATVSDLDPKVYGVIVEDETGKLRGLLLPDIPGVETVRQQVEIAARKAGIPDGISLRLSRFKVSRFREQ
jgi:AmmeMemoRadiSam system protein A/AmmeMemoRadiSam system protein B